MAKEEGGEGDGAAEGKGEEADGAGGDDDGEGERAQDEVKRGDEEQDVTST